MKKICMVTTSDIDFDTRILNEAKTLAKTYNVKIVTKKYADKVFYKPHNFEIFRVNYHRFNFFKLNIFSSFYSLVHALFKENPDVFHAHDLDGLLCAFLPSILKRKTLIYDSHELWSNIFPFSNLKGIRWVLAPLEKFLMLKVKQGITVNHSIAQLMEKKYHKRFFEIYNRPDISEELKAKVNIKQMFPNKKVILQLGIVDEGRGLEEIIKTAKLLPNNFVIVLLGKGKLEAEINQEIIKNNLAKKIIVLPRVKPEEISSAIKNVDLGLALTQKISMSYYLSSPNKLPQYLVAGVPILGSNFPEYKRIILKEKIGEVVDPSKPKLIAQKIIKMLEPNNAKRYRKNLQGIVQNYSWEVEGRKLQAIYNNLFTGAGISRKFKIDVFANLLSLGFLGISGVIINVLIAKFYGTASLGVFNEIYAIYIIASQFAAFSVHLSVQKYLAQGKNQKHAFSIASSGLILTLFFGSIFATGLFLTRNFFASWFHNPEVATGIAYIAIGLVGFAINKTQLAILNGFRRMKAFGFFQALRYLFIVGFILYLIVENKNANILPLSFSFAELLLLPILFIYNLTSFPVKKFAKFISYSKKHLVFGSHALLGNILIDLNTRIDILVLGFFTTPNLVGIYSFSAIIVEGFYQILMTLKINVNPVLARLSNKARELKTYILTGINLTNRYFRLIAIFSVIFYPLIIKFFLPFDQMLASWAIFSILLFFLALSSGYQPFQMLLAQAGAPKAYSLLITSIFLINLVLNIIFVPIMGIYGSALATGISYLSSAAILKVLTKKYLKLSI